MLAQLRDGTVPDSPPAGSAAVDPALRVRLAALGYVSSAAVSPDAGETGKRGRDPKDMVDVYNQLSAPPGESWRTESRCARVSVVTIPSRGRNR